MTERRVRIVDAAAALLGSGGVEALTMRALSESAGVSVPTIYNLVGGRDDVLVLVIERVGTVFDAEIATLNAAPVDRCFDIAEHWVASVAGPTGLARSIIAEGLGPILAGTGAAPLRRYAMALLPAIVDAADQGEIELVTSPKLLVDQLVSLAAIRLYRWATNDRSVDDDGALLRAEFAYGVGLTLAAVATDRTRPGVLARLAAAEQTLPDDSEQPGAITTEGPTRS
jgi:AcrR family transcriptional regulator